MIMNGLAVVVIVALIATGIWLAALPVDSFNHLVGSSY
jgi:hypothetical protein